MNFYEKYVLIVLVVLSFVHIVTDKDRHDELKVRIGIIEGNK